MCWNLLSALLTKLFSFMKTQQILFMLIITCGSVKCVFHCHLLQYFAALKLRARTTTVNIQAHNNTEKKIPSKLQILILSFEQENWQKPQKTRQICHSCEGIQDSNWGVLLCDKLFNCKPATVLQVTCLRRRKVQTDIYHKALTDRAATTPNICRH